MKGFWGFLLVIVLVGGGAAGCGGVSVEELQKKVDEAIKERDEAKSEFVAVQSRLTGCTDSKRVFRITAESEIEALKKKNAELKSKLEQ